jgi:hypothetical protein
MPRRVESFVTGCRSDVRQRTHFSLRRWRPTLVVCTVTRFSLHHLGVSRARLWAAMFKKKKVIESLAHPDGAHTYTHTSHHITSHHTKRTQPEYIRAVLMRDTIIDSLSLPHSPTSLLASGHAWLAVATRWSVSWHLCGRSVALQFSLLARVWILWVGGCDFSGKLVLSWTSPTSLSILCKTELLCCSQSRSSAALAVILFAPLFQRTSLCRVSLILLSCSWE